MGQAAGPEARDNLHNTTLGYMPEAEDKPGVVTAEVMVLMVLAAVAAVEPVAQLSLWPQDIGTTATVGAAQKAEMAG
jgi:hypothetical protein